MYQVLYRKYRPKTFDDVVGQKIVVKTLKNAINKNKISHAYLFCGPRGTGKTSIAKIFAKTINCNNLQNLIPCDKCDSCVEINNNQSIDIIEIDAASNNGVDEIRELKNNVNLVPSTGKYKVYIIDEVHMLTTSAFNALLKTLEEPPKHVIFILATTEQHKIPLTVLSRCQKFDFKKISDKDIVERLKYICSVENIKYEEKALYKIAFYSKGGLRDSLGLLDQLTVYCENQITEIDVDSINGNINNEQMFELMNLIFQKKLTDLINTLKCYDEAGKNLSVVIESLVEYVKNLLIYFTDSESIKDENLINQYKNFENISEDYLYYMINEFLTLINSLKNENNKLLLIQITMIKIVGNIENKGEKQNIITNKINAKIEDKNLEGNINTETLETKSSDNDNFNIIENINKIKKIRINNTLSMFNRKDTIEFKNNLNKLKEYINNSEFGSLVSLILDGNLKAKGDNYILFVYDNNNMEQLFNSELIDIQRLFKIVFDNEYNLIAENKINWNKIKDDFNLSLKNNVKKYNFIEESFNLEKLLIKPKVNKKNKSTEIDNMFQEIVQYK